MHSFFTLNGTPKYLLCRYSYKYFEFECSTVQYNVDNKPKDR